MSDIESKRIDDLSSNPKVTDDDFVVIDGKFGTRKVPIANLIVTYGVDVPSSDYGIPGMLYCQLVGSSINSVYYKLDDITWMKVIPGNYKPITTILSEMTWDQIQDYTWDQIAQFTW